MAIIGDVFHTLTFGGVKSADYDVYITGEGVYNAPARAVEFISVPGRNGDVALDRGHWENIQITYPAGVFGTDQTDFATKISNYRNAIASKIGYQRIEDTYNPNEYRLGVYAAAVEVSPTSESKAGQFNIVFNCKPQRWLKTGETGTEITSGATVTNPTLFDASPLLEVTGYGDIVIDGKTITLANNLLGEVVVSPGGTDTATLDGNLYNNGDSIYSKTTAGIMTNVIGRYGFVLTPVNGYLFTDSLLGIEQSQYSNSFAIPNISGYTFTAGTSKSRSGSATVNRLTVHEVGTSTEHSFTYTMNYVLAYDGNKTISLTFTPSVTGDGAPYVTNTYSSEIYTIYADSTKNSLGNPSYIDLDLGLSYRYAGDSVVSIDDAITLPAKLPTLSPGGNTITFDGTITKLKIVPRWWQV